MNSDLTQLYSIFFDHDNKRRSAFKDSKSKFVHYTTSENFLNIINGRSVWMRNVRLMNDYAEVRHGVELLKSAIYRDDDVEIKSPLLRLFSIVDSKYGKISPHIVARFDGNFSNMDLESYAICLSEHLVSEENVGRLSMWRAYSGGKNGVAIVIKPESFLFGYGHLGALNSPVHYFSNSELVHIIHSLCEKLESAFSTGMTVSANELANCCFAFLSSIALCTKHLGFAEEREWRVFVSGSSPQAGFLKKQIECIRGIPQHVYKIPLEPIAGSDGIDLSLGRLIDSVIIGPTDFPHHIKGALVEAMSRGGIDDAENKVRMSQIPLRE